MSETVYTRPTTRIREALDPSFQAKQVIGQFFTRPDDFKLYVAQQRIVDPLDYQNFENDYNNRIRAVAKRLGSLARHALTIGDPLRVNKYSSGDMRIFFETQDQKLLDIMTAALNTISLAGEGLKNRNVLYAEGACSDQGRAVDQVTDVKAAMLAYAREHAMRLDQVKVSNVHLLETVMPPRPLLPTDCQEVA